VHEDGKGHAELVAVEGALRLTDHDGLKAAEWVLEGVQEPERFGATFPWQGAGRADVEEFLDDLPPAGAMKLRARDSCQPFEA
jgi:hypothetical protein